MHYEQETFIRLRDAGGRNIRNAMGHPLARAWACAALPPLGFDSPPVGFIRRGLPQEPNVWDLRLHRLGTDLPVIDGRPESRQRTMNTAPNQILPADGARRVLFAFVAQWPAAAEFFCSASPHA